MKLIMTTTLILIILNILAGIIRIVFTREVENKILSIFIITTSFSAFVITFSIFSNNKSVVNIALITATLGLPIVLIFSKFIKDKE